MANYQAATVHKRRFFSLPRFLTSEHPFPWLFPSAALMVIFGLYPLYRTIETRCTRNMATRKMVFDPDHNWQRSFDERVWNALQHHVLHELLAFQRARHGDCFASIPTAGYSILPGARDLPLVIPPAVTAMMFLLMLNEYFGVISRGLIAIGLLPFNYSILGKPSSAVAVCCSPKSGSGLHSWQSCWQVCDPCPGLRPPRLTAPAQSSVSLN